MKGRILLVLSLLLVSCSQEGLSSQSSRNTIHLPSFGEPIQIHSQLQQDYLDFYFDSTYDALAHPEVDGSHELSHPDVLTLSWNDDEQHDSYSFLLSQDRLLSNARIIETQTKSISLTNLEIGKKYYYQVKSGDITSDLGEFTIAADGPRNLFIDGITNVRDIGGWKLADGKISRQGLLLRGGRLNASYKAGYESKHIEPEEVIPEITAEGIKEFKKLGIKTEVDFRTKDRNGYPEGVSPYCVVDGVDYVALPMNGNASISDNGESVKAFMDLLCDESKYPFYIHCNIGTDRTGMVCYLLNALLGADEKTLYQDYLFSNFGKIEGTRSASNKYNTYFGLVDYSGKTLMDKAISYFESIGISKADCQKIQNKFWE